MYIIIILLLYYILLYNYLLYIIIYYHIIIHNKSNTLPKTESLLICDDPLHEARYLLRRAGLSVR